MRQLYFHLPYATAPDEHVQVGYSIDGGEIVYVCLSTHDGTHWYASVEAADEAREVRHAYRIVRGADNQTVRVEPNSWRYFVLGQRPVTHFVDAWGERCIPTLYRHTAFTQCVMKPRGGEAMHMELLGEGNLLLLHALPPVGERRWAIVGSSERLGKWDVSKALPLLRTGTYEWGVKLGTEEWTEGVEYKYVLIDPHRPDDITWEEGDNRRIEPQPFYNAAESYIRQDETPRIAAPEWKGAGVVVPVFSLRSEGSYGIGDFGDLRLIIRWAHEVGMQAVQLLPINDTTRTGHWGDSYPYSSISVFALHPIYIDPREWSSTNAYRATCEEARTINALPALNYEAAYALKHRFLQLLFAEIGEEIIQSEEYKTFCKEEARWLEPYADFCALRDRYATADFRSWPEEAHATEVQRTPHRFVQFLLHRQMSAVHNEARELGVILKGDIPIGVSPDSVPVREDGPLFHTNGQAGAPPDAFARHGQCWGFPTYCWEEMARNGYAWWRRRLGHMQRYFDAYRIDHVLGFFRIWEIPQGTSDGLLGRFRPALPLSEDEIRAFGFSADPAALTVPENGAEQNDVLFLHDPERPDHYHPRIAGQDTPRYAALSPADRAAFDRIHEDFFYHRHNAFWAEEALRKLPIITHTAAAPKGRVSLLPSPEEGGMLPCAEDLGMLPASVKGVLDQLQILSLEIQRMPKEWGVRFGDPARYPRRSVATIATHDMAPLRLWWQEDHERAGAYYHDALHLPGDAPEECTPALAERIVADHLAAPSMLCLLALQDWLATSERLRSSHPEDEQINDPANAHQHWQWRMHITLEQLLAASDFADKVRDMILRSKG